MTESQRRFSIAKTSTQKNNIQHIKITRKKQLFLLFWVAENDVGKPMFAAAKTRLINLKTADDYDEHIHKIHCPPLDKFTEIQTIINNWIHNYGGPKKAEVVEVSFFSHAGGDGPMIYSSLKNGTPPEMLIKERKPSQMTLEYWGKINFFWANSARLIFFGCNSASVSIGFDNFSKNISQCENCKNITVIGQTTASYPSFYPDVRSTTIWRNGPVGWTIGPTYMVAGNRRQSYLALLDIGPANTMAFFKNGQELYKDYQTRFKNDHRKNKVNGESEEQAVLKRWIEEEWKNISYGNGV